MSTARFHLSRRSLFDACSLFTCFIVIYASTAARSASADQIQVLTDTTITQSLVSMVMGDVGQPEVLIQGSASPHDYSLRPSDAQRLASTDVLFWTSRNLTLWLARLLDESNPGTLPTESVELMSSPGTVTHTFRDSHIFQHSHEHGTEDEHKPDDDSAHDQHDEDETSEASHDNHLSTMIDPHGWLDPVNAANWVGVIAARLSSIDPDNAEAYNSNADAARLKINELQQSISNELASVPQRQFIVFHDSFQYFETRFNVFASAAIALGDANVPGMRQMNALRDQLKLHENACLFSEPQFSDKLMRSVSRGLDRPIESLDPLGANQSPGPDLYFNVLTQIADSLRDC